MDWKNSFYALRFNDDNALNKQIYSITKFEPHSFVNCRKANLRSDAQSRPLQLEREKASYALSSKPGPTAVCTFIAARIISRLIESGLFEIRAAVPILPRDLSQLP